MRIVFFGTPEFALAPLEALEAKHEIAAIVTQPDRPGNRGVTIFSPVKSFALERGIPLFQFERIRATGVEPLKNLNADAFITAAYGQILSRDILDIPRFGVLNIHASILPAYRGSSPVQWALINGETETGVTIMRTVEGLDSGDILYVKKCAILPADNAQTLLERLSQLGAAAIVECLDFLKKGMLEEVPQDESQATYYPMLKKDDGRIDWNSSPLSIINRIRGVTPWPGAFTHLRGKMLKILSASVSEDFPVMGEMNGQLIVRGRQLFVCCCGGVVELHELQPEGKKRMMAADFLNGFKLVAGDYFE